MEEYENLITDLNTVTTTETKVDKEIIKSIPTTETQKEKIAENEIIEPSTETKLAKFNLKNEVASKKEDDETEEEKNLSQIQVFSNFEDLENHIQNIETKYSANENNSEKSENQS